MKRDELLKIVNKKNITLYEASYALHYLSFSYIHDGEVEKGVKMLQVAANDYLNPLSLAELARVYYHGDGELHHMFPKEHLDDVHLGIDKDAEKSFILLNLAFEIAHHIQKKHGSLEMLKMVGKDGVDLLERFTFKDETEKLKDTEAHRKKLAEDLNHDLELLAVYQKMYTS